MKQPVPAETALQFQMDNVRASFTFTFPVWTSKHADEIIEGLKAQRNIINVSYDYPGFEVEWEPECTPTVLALREKHTQLREVFRPFLDSLVTEDEDME